MKKKWTKFFIICGVFFFFAPSLYAGEMALITSATGGCSEKPFASKTIRLINDFAGGDVDVIEMIDRGSAKGASVRYKIKRLRIVNGTAYPMVWESGTQKGRCVRIYAPHLFTSEQIATLLNPGEKVEKNAFTAVWGRTEFWLIR